MTYKICYWDSAEKAQKERDATPAEAAEINARKVAPRAVPDTAPMAAARKVMRGKGIRDAQVKGIINGSTMTPEEKEDALIDWEYQPFIRRNSPFVAAFGPALGLTEADIDQLFITAAQL